MERVLLRFLLMISRVSLAVVLGIAPFPLRALLKAVCFAEDCSPTLMVRIAEAIASVVGGSISPTILGGLGRFFARLLCGAVSKIPCALSAAGRYQLPLRAFNTSSISKSEIKTVGANCLRPKSIFLSDKISVKTDGSSHLK